MFSIQHITFFILEDHDPNDRNCAFCRKCCIGCCYRIWLKFQDCLLLLVHDMLFDTTVTLCIILNTAFLAVEHHGMSEDLKHVLDIGNKVIIKSFLIYFNGSHFYTNIKKQYIISRYFHFLGLHDIFHC